MNITKQHIWDKSCNYSTSLITLNQLQLPMLLTDLYANNINMLHLDFVDGFFSPEMPLGLRLVEDIIKEYGNNCFYDTHIMSHSPEFLIKSLIDLQVDHINFHYENVNHVDGLLNTIKKNNILAGLALKPATSIYQLEYVIEKCDSVLIMLFNPGYSWDKTETQIEYTYRKVYELREMISRKGLSTKIIVDGRVSYDNIKQWRNGIVDTFVIGSTCVDKNDFVNSLQTLNELKEYKNNVVNNKNHIVNNKPLSIKGSD